MRQTKVEQQDETDLRKNPINVFRCGHKDCAKLDEFKFADFKKHVLAVHGLIPEQLKGSKQMTMHMDGSYWFSYNYTWTLEGGLVFHQYIKMARDRNDPMRF